jgi:hypothetical protein
VKACGNCGSEIRHVFDKRGERWTHTVEPIGHVGEPSDEATRGRARVMRELGAQLDLALERGQTIDAEWVRNWVDWWGDDNALPTPDEEDAAYRKAMAEYGK